LPESPAGKTCSDPVLPTRFFNHKEIMFFMTLSAHRVETAGYGSSDGNSISVPIDGGLITRVGVQTALWSEVAT
jgi:hypothetical protein